MHEKDILYVTQRTPGKTAERIVPAHLPIDGTDPMVLEFKGEPPRPGPPEPSDSKPTNPKDALAIDKMPLHLWPETATMLGALALMEGALKYGRANWRHSGARASVYIDACRRHLAAWFEGEDCAPDSGLPHLAHALACLAILVDAEAAGKLMDDRQTPGGYFGLRQRMEAEVRRLREMHADKKPRHYTIQDR